MKRKTLLLITPLNHLSAMAEGWVSKLDIPSWNIISSCLNKMKQNQLPVEAMKEVNIDITEKKPELFNHNLIKEADVIVSIYDFERDGNLQLSLRPKQQLLQWHIPNPSHFEDFPEKWATYQVAVDELAVQVKKLKKQLK